MKTKEMLKKLIRNFKKDTRALAGETSALIKDITSKKFRRELRDKK